jgi:hypothetical protein
MGWPAPPPATEKLLIRRVANAAPGRSGTSAVASTARWGCDGPADGKSLREPLRDHNRVVTMVAVGRSWTALRSSSLTVICCRRHPSAAVAAGRLDSLVPPLDLPEQVRAIAIHGNVIIASAGAYIAVYQPARLRIQLVFHERGKDQSSNNRRSLRGRQSE